jgi:3-hydroxyacyl-[acyl-carrier-protein] dehydratase
MTEDPSYISPQEIRTWLPHRAPLLLIDDAIKYVEGKSLWGRLKLQESDIWFKGHFPGNPVMPGVLLIEAMAQVGALLAAKSYNIRPDKQTILFSSVDNGRFKLPVIPPADLLVQSEIVGNRRGFVKFVGKAFVADKLVASCKYTAVAVERKK